VSHTRCFAETKQTTAGFPHSSQLVGTLRVEEQTGKCWLVDCNGDEIPLALVLKKYNYKLVCMNVNNLHPVPGTVRIERHYDAP
jgi:hypothetical protein